MGNEPPAGFSIPATGVSTRSSPIKGYVVAEERGIVLRYGITGRDLIHGSKQLVEHIFVAYFVSFIF